MAQRGAAVGGRFCPFRAPRPSKVYLVWYMGTNEIFYINSSKKTKAFYFSHSVSKRCLHVPTTTTYWHIICHIPHITGHRPQATGHRPYVITPH